MKEDVSIATSQPCGGVGSLLSCACWSSWRARKMIGGRLAVSHAGQVTRGNRMPGEIDWNVRLQRASLSLHITAENRSSRRACG